MAKKSIFLTSLSLISIFYFLSSFLCFNNFSPAYAVDFANGYMEDNPQPPPPQEEQKTNPPPSCRGDECKEWWESQGGGGESSQPGPVYYCYLPNPPRGASAAYQCLGTRRFHTWDWRQQIIESPNSICFLGALTCSPEGDPCQKNFVSPSGPGYCAGWNQETIDIIKECVSCPTNFANPCWGCERRLVDERYDDWGRKEEIYDCIIYNNKCCSEGVNEGSCYNAGGDCHWRCHGNVNPPTPTPTPILAPNCKNLSAPQTALVGDTIPISAT